MPAYPWLEARAANADGDIGARLRALRSVGHPYHEETIEKAELSLEGQSELDALIAYIQVLGVTKPDDKS
jgi:cytochrome c oxidase cbb3-type subunit 2